MLFTLCTVYCAIDTAQPLFTMSMDSLSFGPIHSNPWTPFFSSSVTKVHKIFRLALRPTTWISPTLRCTSLSPLFPMVSWYVLIFFFSLLFWLMNERSIDAGRYTVEKRLWLAFLGFWHGYHSVWEFNSFSAFVPFKRWALSHRYLLSLDLSIGTIRRFIKNPRRL